MGSSTDVEDAPAERAGKTIELLLRALPYPEQIRNITIGAHGVRFDWRNARYRVTEKGGVEQVQQGALTGSDNAILMQRCIALAQVNEAATPPKAEA